MDRVKKVDPPRKRLEIRVAKGAEELLPEEFYSSSGQAVWIEEQGSEVLIRVYPERPEEFIRLLEEAGIDVMETRILEEEDQDYQALTLRYFRPIRVEGLRVIPPWTRKRPASPYIVIEPGMAFGTGRHESTRLMVRLMKSVDFEGKRVLDLGCGSAILSLYAEQMGASTVTAVDFDPDAVLSAKKNLQLNESQKVSLVCCNISDIRGTFGVVLANIDIRTFAALSPVVERLLAPGGRLVVSGIIGRDRKKLLSLFPDLRLLRLEQKNSWRGFLFSRD